MRLATVDRWLLAIVPACLCILYLPWLRDRTLFYDEWMYLEELAVSPSRLLWILSPMQEHFAPFAKSIFVFNNWLFGYSGQAFSAVSLLIYLCLVLAMCWFLVAASFSRGTVAVVALLVATAAVYAEVVIWCHDKLSLFLIGLFGALAALLQAKDSARRTLHLVAMGGFTILSMASLGLGIFTLLFLAAFGVGYGMRRLLRRDVVLTLGAAALAFAAVYLLFGHSGVSADFRSRVGDQPLLAVVLPAMRVSVFSFWCGSVLPLLHLGWRPTEATFLATGPWLVLAGVSLVAAAAALVLVWRSSRERLAVLLLGLALIVVSSMTQNFYRAHGNYTGLTFILDWNRYAFLPTIGVVLVLAAVWDAFHQSSSLTAKRLSHLMATAAIAVAFPYSAAEAHRYQTYFFRNARVREVQATFETLFRANLAGQAWLLPDIVLAEPIFVRPLKLSTYARFHRPSLQGQARFVSSAELDGLPAEERKELRASIMGNAELRALYTDEAVAGGLAEAFR